MNLTIGIVVMAAGLTAALWFSVERNGQLTDQLARTEEHLNQSLAEQRQTIEQLAESRKAQARLAQRIDTLESGRKTVEDQLRQAQADRDQLETENAEYQRWANGRLPDSVVGLLHESPLYPDNHLPGLRHDRAAGGTDPAPEPGGHDPKRASAGPD